MNALRRLFRALPETPRACALWLRLRFGDAFARDMRYARPRVEHALPGQRRWRQPIHETPSAANKRHNLHRAARILERTAIQPGQVFSFARAIGPPIGMRGFLDGRTLVGGEVATSAGGGLCQLSGLLYLAALECGMEIVERHPHSLDIYTDATRFAPLGADATVVYGYRDLRFRNPHDQPIGFRCRIDTASVEIEICSRVPLPDRRVDFVRQTDDGVADDSEVVQVVTLLNGAMFCEQRYRRAPPQPMTSPIRSTSSPVASSPRS